MLVKTIYQIKSLREVGIDGYLEVQVCWNLHAVQRSHLRVYHCRKVGFRHTLDVLTHPTEHQSVVLSIL